MDYETGQGAVLMANSENGFLVTTEYMRALAQACHWKSMPRPRSLAQTLVLAAKLKGIDVAIAPYDRSKSAPDVKDRPNEQVLSMLGSRIITAGDTNSGLRALEKNVAEYPASAEALVELGGAYRDASRANDATETFEKALNIDPQNQEARKALAAARNH